MKKRKKCFVLMPFDEKYFEVYGVYKAVCAENDIDCWRVDELNAPGSITRDIIKGIIESDIIIADLTTRNPNVFYELGIAHATGNKTIMTCQKNEILPFDISTYRVIFYEQNINGGKTLADSLGKAIKELLSNHFEANNPVQELMTFQKHKPLKIPLTSAINYSSLTKAVQRYLFSHKITYTTDVHKIDFYDLKNSRGIAREGLSRLVKELLDNNLYDNPDFLKGFIPKSQNVQEIP